LAQVSSLCIFLVSICFFTLGTSLHPPGLHFGDVVCFIEGLRLRASAQQVYTFHFKPYSAEYQS
jgi:hypothetical protein